MTRALILPALALSLALPALVAPGTARADDDRPGPGWMPMHEIAASLAKQGYTVTQMDIDDGVYEVEVNDAQGREREADVDPLTGKILRWDD